MLDIHYAPPHPTPFPISQNDHLDNLEVVVLSTIIGIMLVGLLRFVMSYHMPDHMQQLLVVLLGEGGRASQRNNAHHSMYTWSGLCAHPVHQPLFSACNVPACALLLARSPLSLTKTLGQDACTTLIVIVMAVGAGAITRIVWLMVHVNHHGRNAPAYKSGEYQGGGSGGGIGDVSGGGGSGGGADRGKEAAVVVAGTVSSRDQAGSSQEPPRTTATTPPSTMKVVV
jgi:hypothetical protein